MAMDNSVPDGNGTGSGVGEEDGVFAGTATVLVGIVGVGVALGVRATLGVFVGLNVTSGTSNRTDVGDRVGVTIRVIVGNAMDTVFVHSRSGATATATEPETTIAGPGRVTAGDSVCFGRTGRDEEGEDVPLASGTASRPGSASLVDTSFFPRVAVKVGLNPTRTYAVDKLLVPEISGTISLSPALTCSRSMMLLATRIAPTEVP